MRETEIRESDCKKAVSIDQREAKVAETDLYRRHLQGNYQYGHYLHECEVGCASMRQWIVISS